MANRCVCVCVFFSPSSRLRYYLENTFNHADECMHACIMDFQLKLYMQSGFELWCWHTIDLTRQQNIKPTIKHQQHMHTPFSFKFFFSGALLFFLSKQISCRCTPILMSHCSLESIKVLLLGTTYGHFSFAIGNIFFGTWDKAIDTYFATLITMCTIAKIITFNAYSKWINE